MKWVFKLSGLGTLRMRKTISFTIIASRTTDRLGLMPPRIIDKLTLKISSPAIVRYLPDEMNE